MFTSAKRKQQKQIRQLQCQEKCIDHIPYYLSGLSRAQFFRQPFSKQLYPKEAFISLLKVRSQRFILRDNKPYHKIAKTRAWLVHHMKGKTNVCVCTNLLALLSTMQFCHHRAAPPHPRIYRVPPLGGGGANSTKSFSTVSLSSSYLKSYLRYILSHFIKTQFIFF